MGPPEPSEKTRGAKDRELTALLQRLDELGIKLQSDGEQLRVSAPKGALDGELKASLGEHKAQIMALLSGGRDSKSTTDADSPAGEGAPPWSTDLHLASDLRRAASPPARNSTPEEAPKEVLLTGATGFLGSYLALSLLQQTDAHITCLVRTDSAEAGRGRIAAAFDHYGIEAGEFHPRLRVLPSDLARPNLGLDDETFSDLAESMDVLYHAGATVHHASPYAQLRDANVVGTRRILELSAAGGGIPIHHVSTLSVLPATALPNKPRFFERDPISNYPAPTGGYNLSKWVAEHLLVAGRNLGLPVSIYRPGPVSGDSRNGAFNRNDFLYRLMAGYVQSGLAPDGETSLDLLPVDFVAKAIIALSLDSDSLGKTYHLLHPEPVSSEILFEVCEQAGYPIKRVSYSEWFEHLSTIAQDDKDHPLYPLVGLFSSRTGRLPSESRVPPELPFEITETTDALARIGLPIPPLDHALFETYVAAMLPRDPEGTRLRRGTGS